MHAAKWSDIRHLSYSHFAPYLCSNAYGLATSVKAASSEGSDSLKMYSLEMDEPDFDGIEEISYAT